MKDPIASTFYRDVPSSYVATLYYANLMVLGNKGSGKTSIIRCLQGNPFRQKEPPTVAVDYGEGYCELTTNRHWKSGCHGIDYENELARAVADKLLKYVQSSPAKSNSPPSLPLRPRPRSSSSGTITPYGPPVPPSRRSMLVGGSDSQLDKKSSKRKFSLQRLFRKSSETSALPNSASALPLQQKSPPASPLSVEAPPFISSIPDRIEEKIRESLKDCMGGVLPTKVYGKLIDCPSDSSFLSLSPGLLGRASIFLVVVDVSVSYEKDSCGIDRLISNVGSLVHRLNATFPRTSPNSLLAHSSRSPPPFQVSPLVQSSHVPPTPPTSGNEPCIVLIGTHIDRVRGLVAKENFEKVKKCFKSSACGRYVANASFMMSCSSALEQSLLEDVKKYLISIVKKRCGQEVPLRWLRCIRKFQRLASEKHQYLCTSKDATDIVRESFGKEKEVEDVLRFLGDNNIALCLRQVKGLKDTIVTDPQWFVAGVGKVFSLVHPSARSALPSEYEDDMQMLISQGSLSNRLLDYLWPFSKQVKQELLLLLHSLEIVGLRGSDSRPISPWESESNLLDHLYTRGDRPLKRVKNLSISAVIVPSVVLEPFPPDLSLSCIEPIYFRCDGSFPSTVMPSVAVRCMQMYSATCCLYENASCFQVDESHAVVLEECGSTMIKVSMQPSHHASHLTHTSPSLPSPDVAMATLMFLRATIEDVCNKWMPKDGTEIEMCAKCCCCRRPHYIQLRDSVTDDRTQQCEMGSTVKLTSLILPWFGEDVGMLQQENSALQY